MWVTPAADKQARSNACTAKPTQGPAAGPSHRTNKKLRLNCKSHYRAAFIHCLQQRNAPSVQPPPAVVLLAPLSDLAPKTTPMRNDKHAHTLAPPTCPSSPCRRRPQAPCASGPLCCRMPHRLPVPPLQLRPGEIIQGHISDQIRSRLQISVFFWTATTQPFPRCRKRNMCTLPVERCSSASKGSSKHPVKP